MIMDYRFWVLIGVVTLSTLITITEGRNKKVVIHVPYKVKKIKHTHTIFRTVHHHHIEHPAPASEEHEHIHHVHLHDEHPVGQHSHPVPDIDIPEFLPDIPIKMPLNLPNVPVHDASVIPNRHGIPLYKRKI